MKTKNSGRQAGIMPPVFTCHFALDLVLKVVFPSHSRNALPVIFYNFMPPGAAREMKGMGRTVIHN
jgi:hypothetical protein